MWPEDIPLMSNYYNKLNRYLTSKFEWLTKKVINDLANQKDKQKRLLVRKSFWERWAVLVDCVFMNLQDTLQSVRADYCSTPKFFSKKPLNLGTWDQNVVKICREQLLSMAESTRN